MRFLLAAVLCAAALAGPAAAAEPSQADLDACRVEDQPDHKAAVAACTRLIKAGADMPDFQSMVLAIRASNRMSLGQVRLADADFAAAIAAHPASTYPLILQGESATARSDFAAALASYDAAIKLDPESPTLLGRRGLVLVVSGAPAAGVADLDKAIAARPDDAGLFRDRGRGRTLTKDYEGAITDFDRAEKLAGPNADILEG